MEYFDTGIIKCAIGIPTDEERIKLEEEGYTHMANGKMEPDENGYQEPFEQWIK